MEVAISHRNHNIAGPHPVEAANPIVGGMVRIDGQSGLGQCQGGLLPLCKNIFGFVAKLCQASYKSNAKTTYRTRPPEHPHRQSRESGNPGQAPFASPFALSLSKGAPSPQAHPDTSPWRPSQRPRYPSPMQHACNDLNQDIASTSAPWRSSPAPRMSTIASASASENRRLFRTGAKVENRSL